MSTKVKHFLSSDFVDTYKNIKKGEIVEYENKTYRVIWIVMELGEAIIFLQKIKKDGKPYSNLAPFGVKYNKLKNIEAVSLIFPKFEWTYSKEQDTYFGVKQVDRIDKKLGDKSRVSYYSIYIIISSFFEKNGSRYAMCWQKIDITPYRCRNSHEAEFNKSLVFDASLDKLLEKLNDATDMNKFVTK
jgi:hypothetical protein